MGRIFQYLLFMCQSLSSFHEIAVIVAISTIAYAFVRQNLQYFLTYIIEQKGRFTIGKSTPSSFILQYSEAQTLIIIIQDTK